MGVGRTVFCMAGGLRLVRHVPTCELGKDHMGERSVKYTVGTIVQVIVAVEGEDSDTSFGKLVSGHWTEMMRTAKRRLAEHGYEPNDIIPSPAGYENRPETKEFAGRPARVVCQMNSKQKVVET